MGQEAPLDTTVRMIVKQHPNRFLGKLVFTLLLLGLLKELRPSLAQTSVDELALLNFRSRVISDPNNALVTWNRTTSVCSWHHVTCDANNRVIRLDLSNQGLVGTIGDSLGDLEFLEYLDLRNNNFRGAIPRRVELLPHLHEVEFSTNYLRGNVLKVTSTNLSITTSLNECRNCKRKVNSLRLALEILGGVTGFLLLSISVYFFWKCRRRTDVDAKSPGFAAPVLKKSSSRSLVNPRPSISERARNSTTSFTIKELKAATQNFSPENVIGEGGFGLVYKGTLPTGQDVAIKHAHNNAQQGVEEFYNEVELLSKVHHKYLVDLIGYCDEQDEQLLVYEFIPNGNLFEHLCGQRTPHLTWRQRVHIAICCAKALAHLHECCIPSIIHRDIKPSNILLDNDLMAKVADFGLSKTGPVGGASHVSTGVKGTPGYLDPYYYLNWHLGAYSDVYSFGVILLQLVASKPAVDRRRRSKSSTSYSLVAWARDCLRQGLFEEIVDPKLRAQGYNKDIMLLMVKLGIRCTGEEIKGRPSMSAIYKVLEHALSTRGSEVSVKTSPVHSPGAYAEDGESTPESLGTAEGEEELLYNRINFDGRSWIDITNLDAAQFEDPHQDYEHPGDALIQISLDDPEPEASKQVNISIDDPEPGTAKQIRVSVDEPEAKTGKQIPISFSNPEPETAKQIHILGGDTEIEAAQQIHISVDDPEPDAVNGIRS